MIKGPGALIKRPLNLLFMFYACQKHEKITSNIYIYVYVIDEVLHENISLIFLSPTKNS